MQYNYTAPCSKKNLSEIRNFVNEALKAHFKSEIDIHHMVLAVDEVCANLMIHSHKCNPDESIQVLIDIRNREVIFEIRDNGNGFNMENYREPTIKEMVVEKKKGGLGLMLVKRIMDKVEFLREKNTSVCRLRKKIMAS